VRTSFAAVFWTATVGALIALPFAGPISDGLLKTHDPGLVRIAIGGLWVLTLFEYLLTLFRLEERARAYFLTTMANVLTTIPVTVALVVGADDGARGLLLGSYATGAVFVAILIAVHWRRLGLRIERPLFGRLMRFGLPTMPAELSLYSRGWPRRGSIRWRSSSRRRSTCWCAAFSSPGLRSPTRSATTTRRGVSTRWS
jgi:O-antigen/teichoic acid export membrane protein